MLSSRVKIILIAVLTVIIIGILVLPTSLLKLEFKTTQNPITVYNQAKAEGKPIYLEFYASW